MPASSRWRLPPPESGWISGTFWLAFADATSDFRALETAMPHGNLKSSHQRRATIWRIKTITGTIIESSRFTNKPMHWHERPVCNERRELWLATSHEDEHSFIIHTKLIPSRKTHCVTLVLAGSTVLGLYNATTGASANYIREDPPADLIAVGLVQAMVSLQKIHAQMQQTMEHLQQSPDESSFRPES